MSDVYDATYYAELLAGSRRSAERILPAVFDLVRPASVTDFGCGSGAWLGVAARLGAEITGFDGPWVEPDTLEFPAGRFRPVDLATRFQLEEHFDLAICVEVAEHLPATAAAMLVENLADHASAILFSAAVPEQGGADHINEAWPEEWRDLFAKRGFDCHDVFRGRFWKDDAIEIWYRQNLLLFLKREWASNDNDRTRRLAALEARPLSIVHPDYWMERQARLTYAEADRDAAWAEVQTLQDVKAQLWNDAAALSKRCENLAKENARLLKDDNRSSREIADLKARLTAMRQSRSWRLTAPLRRLRRGWGRQP